MVHKGVDLKTKMTLKHPMNCVITLDSCTKTVFTLCYLEADRMFPIIALSDSSVGIEREFNREHDRRELTIVNCRENMLLAKRVFTETKLANTSSCYILSLTHGIGTKESDSQKCV